MYTKEVRIPALGEKSTVPDVQGVAVQVVRLDFLGAEDPLGNPVIESLQSPNRSWSTEATEADPITSPFRGLVVRNPSSTAAAGTIMILEVYEDESEVRNLQARKRLTARAPVEIVDGTLYDVVTVDLATNGNVTLDVLPGGEEEGFVRIEGVTLAAIDNGDLVSGARLDWRLQSRTGSKPIRGGSITAEVGRRKYQTVARDLLYTPTSDISLNLYHYGGGEGDVILRTEVAYYYDAKNVMPPR